jgi:5-methyltetrahydrofolate--homocysteine methyltransferase
MEPMGELTFDDMVKNFTAQAEVLVKAGVDFILLETITDIQEFRAAVVGILSAAAKIPVMASMSFTSDDLTFSGTDGRAFAVTAEFPGVSAVGSNCGASLESMKRVMEKIAAYSHLPLVCQPNAGLPVLEDGKTVFKVTADEFAGFMEDIYGLGAALLGSCCGSTPDFTKKLAEKFKHRDVVKREIYDNLILSSRTTIKEISLQKMFLVGERINPTGRKKLRKELETGRLTTVRLDAAEQEKHGSDALDINVNLHKLDLDTAKNIIKSVRNLVNIPLFIDSMDPVLIEEFAKLFAGKGVINSISGEKASFKKLLPLARKYNMAFIAVLMDEKGISDSARTRIKIAKRIVKKAKKYGIPLRNIIFDPLVLSAGAEIEKVTVTLETLERLKKAFPLNKTIMGLSNVSFGLPNRELVNAVYLTLAAAKGLDMVIANPLHESIRSQVMTIDFLRTGSKENLARYAGHFSDFKKAEADRLQPGSVNLYDNILAGDGDSAVENIKTILDKEAPAEVIEKYIVPAMDEVGRRYREQEYFLPQLIASADVVKSILPFIKQKLPRTEDGEKHVKVLFATVKGDVHDIGKNVVISILESFNFTVIDLGKDVPVETVVSEAVKVKADVVGLSTLMTTTLPAMLETVEAIKKTKQLKDVKIFLGGAVINNAIAEEAGVFYAKDGMEMVQALKV